MERSTRLSELREELRRYRARKVAVEDIDQTNYPAIYDALGATEAYEATRLLKALLENLSTRDKMYRAASLSIFGHGDTVLDRFQVAADADYVDVRTTRRHSDAGIEAISSVLADQIYVREFGRSLHDIHVARVSETESLITLHSEVATADYLALKVKIGDKDLEHVAYEKVWEDSTGRHHGLCQILIRPHEHDVIKTGNVWVTIEPNELNPTACMVHKTSANDGYFVNVFFLLNAIVIIFNTCDPDWTRDLWVNPTDVVSVEQPD